MWRFCGKTKIEITVNPTFCGGFVANKKKNIKSGEDKNRHVTPTMTRCMSTHIIMPMEYNTYYSGFYSIIQ
tara:strand:+ start:5138 stop:5350 length:213 start_codon:yes stop_codon:yes gene_type:complete